MIVSDGKSYQPEGYDYAVDPISGRQIAISRATGDESDAITVTIPVNTILYTPDQQDAMKKRKEQLHDFFNQKAQLDSLGRFSFAHTLQRFEDVSPETAARIIYLSAFLKLEAGGALFLTRRCKMSRDSLPEVMGLSRQTVSRFLDEVCPKYITFDSSDNLSMNPKYFRRGKIGRHGESMSWQKIYIDSVKKLYRTAGKNMHRYLGYVFKMLPYINIQYNMLCYDDIFEKNLNNIRQMTDKDFCKEIGYDYSQIARLRKVYKGVRFEVGGRMEAFCAFVDAGCGTRIFINPHILYSGTRPDLVEILGSFCAGA